MLAVPKLMSAVTSLAYSNPNPTGTNTGSRRWGIVAEKTLRLGMLLLERNNCFRLSVEDLEVEHRFPQSNCRRCKLGHRRKLPPILILAFACRRVREIAPLVTESREATVTIDMPSTSLLRPGMFARAAITTTTVGLTVPAKAVQPQPDGSAIVFLLSGEDSQTKL